MLVLRSLLAIACGLFILSLVAEGIEFTIVTAVHGSIIDDPNVYLGIRNQRAILASKLIYNTVAAILAGYVTAWVAGRASLVHGVILALIQLVLFSWGMIFSEYAGTTPAWAWLTLLPLMGGGICVGAALQAKRRTRPAATRPGPSR